MAWLAASLLRRAAGKPPPAAQDLGSRLHAEPDRHAGGVLAARRAGARRPARPRDRRLRSLDARRVRSAGALSALVLLAACTGEAPVPEPEATEIPAELAGASPPRPAETGIGTPMEARLAVLGRPNQRTD